MSVWQGRKISKEEELELHLTVIQKIHDYIFSLDAESEEFDELCDRFEVIGASFNEEEIDSLEFRDIVDLTFEEEFDSRDDSTLETLYHTECGLFSSLKRNVHRAYKKTKHNVHQFHKKNKELLFGVVVAAGIITAGGNDTAFGTSSS